MLSGIAKRLQVGHDRSCRRIDHVTGVAHEHEAAVPAVLNPAISLAIVKASYLFPCHRPQRDIGDLPRGSCGDAADVEDVDVAVRRVQHIELLLVGGERYPVARGARRESRRVVRESNPESPYGVENTPGGDVANLEAEEAGRRSIRERPYPIDREGSNRVDERADLLSDLICGHIADR